MSQQNLSHLLSVGVISLITGFCISQYCGTKQCSRSKLKDSKKIPKVPVENLSTEDESEYEDDSEDESIDIDSTPLNDVPGEVRMTLIVRQDLKMGKGKAAAQCSHATLALYKKISNPESEAYNPEMVNRWEYGNGQAKITLQVPNQEEMDTLFAQAISLDVNAYIVHDAGRTQIAAGSATVLGLGPAPKLVIDQITKDLKLY
ncbi:DEHA2A07524p [Debaryomyces hansenii CBS767]|uniref:peptidyl-tRNA hydrolase n=1 Tax=Debaryomyces hansenii (strain ATCC 36239 / CBS 767 / BCRC 21394 / JCM 1990 / NBRC 0083 / IGC 2968) TaxID=284592 RepID=Q6BYR5_DEBHA|nr:DEHA2A07524p [Debaryomyces hansenii CBS767]CAG84610.2 DEHA2A07524p [Debaryomyces hansenii CBS767]|eukprot:XP_456654.2 DEHA2A07524p [Debaryomyces hansenii CBS767]